MSIDVYASCPCGSGKKFKWCCQPIHGRIEDAFEQQAQGQHAAAIKLMDDLVAAEPDNPEAWGRRAQLLYENGRYDDAETSLDRALQLNPRYPFGYLLKGVFRHEEGETAGALRLFRQAADLYDPAAHDHLGQVFSLIAESELRANRPVAAHAALKLARRYRPADEALRETTETLFGEKSQLPLSPRRDYSFRAAPGGADADRQSWADALAAASTGRLGDAAAAFQARVEAHPDDAAAWYNLAVCRAWLGANRTAVEALDRYVALECDESAAEQAWALGEVLRCGQGLEEQSDYVEYSALYQLLQPEAVVPFLQDMERRRRLVGVKAFEEQGLLTALVLEKTADLTPELAAAQLPGLAAYVMLLGDQLRLWNTDAAALADARQEFEQALGPALSPARPATGPANFHDVLAGALFFPVHATDAEQARARVEEATRRYFEEKWIHKPRHSLGLVSPVDAAGHAVLRKKLRGVIRFIEECAAPSGALAYDFNRLRRKLGLTAEQPPAGEPRPADVTEMSAAELSALKAESLSDQDLEAAFQAAAKLDARELAGRFARALVARPATASRPDRFPLYAQLVNAAVAERDFGAALGYVDEGERFDCENNGGRRRNDFELRRAQVLAKSGDAAGAADAFSRLVERAPLELRYRGAAAEAMLSANEAARATAFAEGGLAGARQANDRDSEQYFRELLDAAQKMSRR